jgi:chromosome segregation ATPase
MHNKSSKTPTKHTVNSKFEPNLNYNDQFSDISMKLIKTDKIVIPQRYTDEHKHIRPCEQKYLPSSKSYLISEENYNLLERAIRKKDEEIKKLKKLLLFSQKPNTFNENIETTLEKNKQLLNENNKLKSYYDDISAQLNKYNVLFSKFIDLINFTLTLNKLYCPINTNSPPLNEMITSKINELRIQSIFSFISKQSPYNYNINTFNNNELNDSINTFLNETYIKNEKQVKEYKKKYYDAKNLLDILNTKNWSNKNELTTNQKDIIETKIRLNELHELNDNLERDNNYLRTKYQKIYCNMEDNKRNDNEKYEQLSLQMNEVNNKNILLCNELNELQFKMNEVQNKFDKKENNIKELSQSKEKMRAQIKEKENVINDLKSQLKELQEQYEDLSNEYKKNQEIMLNDKKQLINSVKQKEKEIQMLTDKLTELENDDNNIVFEYEGEKTGINGINYICNMFMILYNQGKLIEEVQNVKYN